MKQRDLDIGIRIQIKY